MSDNNLIFLTGFGVFAGHEDKNASWEAVKLVPDTVNVGGQKYTIRKIEIPVIYDDVDKIVEQIWEEKPLLVIHVGVHSKIKKINLEKCSKSAGYCKSDYNGKCLPCDQVQLKNNCCDVLHTNLDVDTIVKTLNDREKIEKFVQSCDVGNYLCGYTYLKSLDIDRERSLFVHVPPINKPFSSSEVKEGLISILEMCLIQLTVKNSV